MKKVVSVLVLSAVTALTPAFAKSALNYNLPSTNSQVVEVGGVSNNATPIENTLQTNTVSTTLTPTTSTSSVSQGDLSYAFAEESVQASEMSQQEQAETEGAWLIM